jgi:hypothetical protein
MRRRFALALSISAGLMMGACADSSGGTQITSPSATSGELRTLMDVTEGLDVTSGQVGTFNWAGQSFVVPDTGTLGDLRFNFYNYQKRPVAFGSLFLLTQEFLGVPAALNSSTPGFVARAESSAEGIYTFANSAVVTGGTKYWVYTDAQGSFAGSFDTDIYQGGDLYVTGFPTNPFRKAQASGRMVNGVLVPAPPGVFVDANFRLQARRR